MPTVGSWGLAFSYASGTPVPRRLSGIGVDKEREFFIDNLLVRNHLIIVMMRWTGLAPWGFELTSYPCVPDSCTASAGYSSIDTHDGIEHSIII